MITKMNPSPMSQRTERSVVPACGHVLLPTAAPAARVRLVKGTWGMGHVGIELATAGDVAYFPGTRAWSPPPC